MATLTLDRLAELEFYTFEPRPDQVERNDQQTSFYWSQHEGPTALLGGNGSGCCAGEQEVFDPIENKNRRIDSIGSDFHVVSRSDNGLSVVALAKRPTVFADENLWEITLSSGESLRVTFGHRLLTEFGWQEIGDILKQSHPSQFQALRSGRQREASLCGGIRLISSSPEDVQSERLTAFGQNATLTSPDAEMSIKGAYITAVRFLRRDVYWDFHVPMHENYLMGGVWNHNTTTLGLAKAIKFMCFDQPPPRRDTPFWIIAGSYPQVMNACWKEKLHQKGHLEPNSIDWGRISWYKPNNDWPFSVPLKAWPGRPGKNWLLCFKSYEQGRAAMQAEAIGGFLFVEQFPWGLLEEVMRGCREYAFTGNKLIEFTPVDPSLCVELRDMEENQKLPESWGLYRCNTRCAMEAGHITEQWYRDFFGMVPDNMKPVREQGLWGNFVGAIYPEFSSLIHCLPDDWKIPPGWHHRRAVDFGFSLQHPFVCLFYCFDNRGRFVVYDEYYSNDTTKTVIDHWKCVADMHPWPDINPYYGVTWVDHDLDAIGTLSKIAEYTKSEEFPDGEYEGPSMQLAHKPVHEGIEYVKMLLKRSMQVTPGVFEPRLKILKKNCPNLCREFITYRWHKQLQVGVNAQAIKDEPVKMNDDCMDALRMGLFSEAHTSGNAPSSLAKRHSPGSVQISTEKFTAPPPRRIKKRGR